jgi:hypothetical protein
MNIRDCTGIHVIDKNKETTKKFYSSADKVVTAYAFDGHGTQKLIDPNHMLACAKIEISKSGGEAHFLKVCKIGRLKGRLINPKSDAYELKDLTAKIGGISCYQWHYVPKKTFDLYLTFLKTGVLRWLKEAQRELATS